MAGLRRGDRPVQQVPNVQGRDSDSAQIETKLDHVGADDARLPSKLKKVEEKNPFISSRVIRKAEELPSKGLAYPEGWSISFRSFSYGEIEKVAQTFSLVDMYEIGLAGMETEGFDKRDMTLQDFLYMFLLRRIQTMGTSRVQLATVCPLCEQNNVGVYSTHEFDFDELEIPSLPITASMSDREVKFAPMTIGRWIDVLQEHQGESVSRVEFQAHSMNLAMPEVSYKECEEYLAAIEDPDDISVLNEIDKMMYHGAKIFEFKCNQDVEVTDESSETCGFTYRVKSSSVLESFVYPFRDEQYERDIKNKIRFD